MNEALKRALSASGLSLQEAKELRKQGRMGVLKTQGFGKQALAELERLCDTVIVTRHSTLAQHLSEKYGIKADSVISHATAKDIAGCNVIGILPNRLACWAISITEVDLDIPAEFRGVELTFDML